MDKFNNIETFSNSYGSKEDIKIEKQLFNLMAFTLNFKLKRDFMRNVPTLYNNIKKDSHNDGCYLFLYEDRKIPFSIFSDLKLQKRDKKILESFERLDHNNNFPRTLKLACSMDLVNPRVTIGNNSYRNFSLIILFEEKGIDKVIDYSNNLIMNKEDYYQIFKFQEINTVDKFELYKIYQIVDELNDYKHIYEYLIFTKDILNDISKNEHFKSFREKYDKNGINRHNYVLFGENCDILFFQDSDGEHRKCDYWVLELDKFTENPEAKTKHISFNGKRNKYVFRQGIYKNFEFGLLSDILYDGETKDMLLSKNRYHECHYHSNLVAKSLPDALKREAYVVCGKVKINEIDYFYHSWVELEDKNTVIDFNHNLIMNKDKYYKLFKIVPISKTHILELEDALYTIFKNAELSISQILLINCFGSDIMRDLKKNEKVLKKIK